jgi:hypothetical protein
VNLEQLRNLADQADTLAEELRTALARAEARRDPLGVHIFAARASFRRTSDADKTKSGRRTETELHLSSGELQLLSDWIDTRFKEKFVEDHDLLVMGDFNTPKLTDPIFGALISHGLKIPKPLVNDR